MPTFGDLKAQVASDLRRSNLTTEIATEIQNAINDHSSERFYFNETYPQAYALIVSPGGGISSDFNNSTPLGDTYALAPQGPVQEFIKIDMVRAQIPVVWYTVKATDWTSLEFFYSTLSKGQPSWWSYRGGGHSPTGGSPTAGGYLRIYPLPSQNYNLRIFGHYRVPDLVNDADSNIWTNEAFNLIRYTALRRLYSFPIRDAQQVQNATQAGQGVLDYLRRETGRRTGQGRMRAYYG